MISYLISDAKFWTGVAFIIFILITFKPIKSTVIKNLDDKINKIKNDIKEAEKIEEDAKKLLAKIKVKEKNLENEINEIINIGKSKIEYMKKEMSEKLEMQIVRRKNLSEIKIKHIEHELIEQIKEKTSYFTVKTLKNIIQNKIDDKIKNDLMMSSLKDLNHYSKN